MANPTDNKPGRKAAGAVAATAPQVLSLPPMPGTDFWTPTQWEVLMSLADAVLAPVVPESKLQDKARQIRLADAKLDEIIGLTLRGLKDAPPPGEETLKQTLAERFTDNPACVAHLRRTVATIIPLAQREKMGGALSAVATRWGAFFLTGYCTPIQNQPVHVREGILKAWLRSRIPAVRLLSKSIASLSQLAWLQTSPLFKQVSGYTEAPRGWKAGPGFDFKFMQFPSAESEKGDGAAATGDDATITIETDVVIVGSGCGGGVCAKVLAEAGHRVLVLDKGYYFTPSQLPMTQEQGSRLMLENGGLVASADGSINIVAGATWGGGGTVNWSVSLQTQGFVRREWAQDRGLSFFETQEFQECLDRVCGYMGATPGSERTVPQSHRGQVLLNGSRKLGWQAGALPQNCGGADHECGRCMLGCHSAEKRGPTVSWLPDAAKAGAQFIEGFTIDRVLFEDDNEAAAAAGAKRVATGVVGTWVSRDNEGGVGTAEEQRIKRRVVVKAKKVIVSAGSLWSPVILTKSGVKNRHLGHHLHVHPCNMVGAYYKEKLNAWEEGIITSYCTSFENLDTHGHGVKLEPTCQIPYTCMAQMPWRGGLDFKLAAARYGHMDVYISLTRDRDTGSVEPHPVSGKPVVHYTPSEFDRAHTLEGVIAIAKCCYIMGATEIRAFVPGVEPFVRADWMHDEAVPATTNGEHDDYVAVRKRKNAGKLEDTVSSLSASTSSWSSASAPTSSNSSPSSPKLDLGVGDPDFASWLETVRKAGNPTPDTCFQSAHQMGTCRMGVSEDDGVVDPRGKVWAAENLYVADASVFPSASGVNPMVTNMAISDWIARGISRELSAEVVGKGATVVAKGKA